MNNGGKGLRLLAVGDVAISRDNPVSIFDNVRSLLNSTDVRIANFEGVVCGEEVPPAPGKVEAGSGGVLRQSTGAEKGFAEAGFQAVSIANNHMMDHGEEGILQTMELLRGANISYAGGGKNDNEAHQPCFVEHQGLRIALLSYTSVYVPVSFPAGPNKPGLAVVNAQTAIEASFNLAYQPGSIPRIITWANPEHKERMVEDIRQCKKKADVILVAFHWGQTARGNARSLKVPMEIAPCFVCEYQEELGRAAVDAGANLVMGHHPHELEGIEIYNGSLICYSLGNFAFEVSKLKSMNMRIRDLERDSVAVKLRLKPETNEAQFTLVPVRLTEQGEPRVVPPTSADGKRILRSLELHSEKYGTVFEVQEEEVIIKPSA